MKTLYRNKFFSIMLFVFIIFKTLDLPYYNYLVSNPTKNAPRIISIEYMSAIASISLQRLRSDFEPDLNPRVTDKLSLIFELNHILSLLSGLIVLIIDKRQRIITLITRYFEGGKYKNSVSFLKLA